MNRVSDNPLSGAVPSVACRVKRTPGSWRAGCSWCRWGSWPNPPPWPEAKSNRGGSRRDAHLRGPRRGHRPTQVDGPVVLNLDARPLLRMHHRPGCGHQDEQEPKVEWGANEHHRGRKLYVNGKGTVALADCFPGVAGDFTRGRPSETREPFRPSRRPGIRPRAGPRGRPLGASPRAAR